ncbi:MAG: hypothetical protein WED82_01990 [Balneolales bacterium]
MNPPLTFQEFQKVLFKEHPETKSFTRANLRRIYRDYKKQRKNTGTAEWLKPKTQFPITSNK